MKYQVILTVFASSLLLFGSTAVAEPESAKKSLLVRIFGDPNFDKKDQSEAAPVGGVVEDEIEIPDLVSPDDSVPSVTPAVAQVPIEGSEIRLKTSRDEAAVDSTIFRLQQEFDERLSQFDDPELALTHLRELADVPQDFETAWRRAANAGLWPGENVDQTLENVYAAAVQHSYQVKDLTFNPLVQETNIGVAEAQFNTEAFAVGEGGHLDEPTGTTLATGSTGRLLEDEITGQFGVRKRLKTGAEIEVANGGRTIDNNSTFLDPNPQTQSDISIRVLQPILRGRGVDYNTISIKLATIDTRIAAADMISALEQHLLDVNRAYWAVYLSRAAYAQRVELVETTQNIVRQLQDREELDPEATASEIVRARAALVERRADLIRSKTAIRTSEERLRFLVNDPDLPMGDRRELIPATRPILNAPAQDVRTVAQTALANRAEVSSALNAIRAAGLRQDSAENDLLPQLNLVGEVGYAGLGEGRRFGEAYEDQFESGTSWNVGFNFSQTLERDFAKSFNQRRQLEYHQTLNRARLAADSVILSVLVSYREMATAYRDMQAKYAAVEASREEIRKLEELVDLDAGADAGQTVGYRLQLLLDAIERNQASEESFLVSVVAYNFALASMERSKGTFLQFHDVEITREDSGTWRKADRLNVEKVTPVPAVK